MLAFAHGGQKPHAKGVFMRRNFFDARIWGSAWGTAAIAVLAVASIAVLVIPA
ncbi:hypothetical protein RA210_U40135 [Rubrivivax sp. A210]|nr:hypothetical protein RA210_U40135 [Rubrivivax sp. A210]